MKRAKHATVICGEHWFEIGIIRSHLGGACPKCGAPYLSLRHRWWLPWNLFTRAKAS